MASLSWKCRSLPQKYMVLWRRAVHTRRPAELRRQHHTRANTDCYHCVCLVSTDWRSWNCVWVLINRVNQPPKEFWIFNLFLHLLIGCMRELKLGFSSRSRARYTGPRFCSCQPSLEVLAVTLAVVGPYHWVFGRRCCWEGGVWFAD